MGDAEESKVWAKEFLKEKIGMECQMEKCWKSGLVIIVKIENEERKREVIISKHKLKRGKIFIENDLSFKKREIQKKINRWVKKQKDKGEVIKVGLGRVIRLRKHGCFGQR